ncbi:hypothetical protein [Terriglobus albidus]|uniref:hypothetical protein n=1 Tax=Terriglobus albidus TaxID=1592106 RepID=UPI0021DFFC0F|nr:hypothetical protein [Terriglobus albidus]
MKKFLFCLFFFALPVVAQNLRVDFSATTTTGSGTTVPVVAYPNAGIAIYSCSSPAASSCTSLISTFTSITGTSVCPATAQVVLQGTNTCVNTADSSGNFGAWLPPSGSFGYAYTETVGTTVYGPFQFTAGVTTAGDLSVSGTLSAGSIRFPNAANPPTAIDGSSVSTSLVLSPYTFGAKCDAAWSNSTGILTGTDDRVAFRAMAQAALAGGAVIEIPAGKICRVDPPGGVITSVQIAGNIVTFNTSSNKLSVGDYFMPHCMSSASYLNGALLQVQTATTTAVTAHYIHANLSLVSEPGGGYDLGYVGQQACPATISNMAAPSVIAQGVPGSTTYSYEVVASEILGQDPSLLDVSTSGAVTTITNGNANLSSTNCNLVSWPAASAANGYRPGSYKVYRTAGGANQGLIATLSSRSLSYCDAGAIGDSTSPPSANTTQQAAAVLESPAILFSGTGNLGMTVRGSNVDNYSEASRIAGIGIGSIWQFSTDKAALVTTATSDASGNVTINYESLPGGLIFNGNSYTLWGTGTGLDGTYGNGSTTISYSANRITISGAGAPANVNATGGAVHQPYTQPSFDGYQGAKFEDVDMRIMNRPQNWTGGVLYPTDGQYSYYSPGTYIVKDYRGGDVKMRHVYMAGCEYCFWGIQTDFDRFERISLVDDHVGIYIGPNSGPIDGIDYIDGGAEQLIQVDGNGQQGMSMSHLHPNGSGNGRMAPIGIFSIMYDPTAGYGGGSGNSMIEIRDSNFEFGNGVPNNGCKNAPIAFVDVDAVGNTTSDDVIIKGSSYVNASLATTNCNVPYFVRTGRNGYAKLVDNQGVNAPQFAAWFLNIGTLNPTYYVDSQNPLAAGVANYASTGSGTPSVVQFMPYKVGSTTSLNTTIQANGLTANSGYKLSQLDDGSTISGTLVQIGASGTPQILVLNGGNPTSARNFSFQTASGQVSMLAGTGGIVFRNSSGTPLSSFVLSSDMANRFGYVNPGLLRFRSDQNSVYGRLLFDDNTNYEALATLMDLGCGGSAAGGSSVNKGPSGTPSNASYLRGDCTWSIPILSGATGGIGGSPLSAGTCASTTTTVAGAQIGSPVTVSTSDGTLPSPLVKVDAAVTAIDTVTVQVCAISTVTPVAKAYNVRVMR